MYKVSKRVFDVALTVLLAFLLAPLLVLIALVIRLTSNGPAIFSQPRLGRDGEIFNMHKFRKFPSDWGTRGPQVTVLNDTRMTAVGRFLERTKLDELPQLLNILKGEMSFVGPRPETLNFENLFKGRFAQVLDYQPGIFGPNQTKFRNESSLYPVDIDPEEFYAQVLFPEKADNDIDYFSKATLTGDFKWLVSGIFSTLFNAVLWRRITGMLVVLFAWDLIASLAGWTASHYLREGTLAFERHDPALADLTVGPIFDMGLWVLPLVVFVVFCTMRVNRNPIRFFSESDLYRLIGANAVAWLLMGMVVGFLYESTSSLLLAVSCLISTVLMVAPRIAYQWFWKHNDNWHHKNAQGENVNILVAGVNRRSIELCKLFALGFTKANVVGLLDNSGANVGRSIGGFVVLGMQRDLEMIHARYKLDYVWLSHSIDKSQFSALRMWCESSGVELVCMDREPLFQSLVQQPPASAQQELQENLVVKPASAQDVVEPALLAAADNGLGARNTSRTVAELDGDRVA